MAPPQALVVGCGVHATTVLVPCLQYAGVRVAGAVDPDGAAVAAFAATTGARPYPDLAGALADRYDLAVVAAPPHEQGRIVRTLIERSLPVFCEKPGGADAADLARTLALATDCGVPVQVGFMRRYAPPFRVARHAVRRERPLVLQVALAAGPAPDRLYHARDVGVHVVDLARYFLGELALVSAVDSGGGWQCLVQGAGGTGALCLSDQGSWGVASERVWISAPGVTVTVDDYLTVRVSRAGRLVLDDDRPARFPDTGSQLWTPNFTSPRLLNNSLYLQGYLGELDAFLRCLAVGGRPTPGLVDAHAAMSLVETVAKAIDLEP